MLLFNLPFTVACLLKGKVWSGLFGVYLSPLAMFGAMSRLAGKPDQLR